MLEGLVAWVLNNYIGEYLENLDTDHLKVCSKFKIPQIFRLHFCKAKLNCTTSRSRLQHCASSIYLSRSRRDSSANCGSNCRSLNCELSRGSCTLRMFFCSCNRPRPKWGILIFPYYSSVTVRRGSWRTKEASSADATRAQIPTARRARDLSQTSIMHGGEGWLASRPLSRHNRRPKRCIDERRRMVCVRREHDEHGRGEHTSERLSSVTSSYPAALQLNVTSVHVRVEDGVSLGNGRRFGAGIRMQRLTVHTTDGAWKRQFVNRGADEHLYKVLEMDGVSMYWDSDCPANVVDNQQQLIVSWGTVVWWLLYDSVRSTCRCRKRRRAVKSPIVICTYWSRWTTG